MSSRRREAPRAVRRADARRSESRGGQSSIIDQALAWTRANAAMLWFAAAAKAMCVLWMVAFSLRVPIWDTDPLLIAKPVVMSRVFPGGFSSYMNTLLAISAISAAYLVCLWALRRGFRHDFAAAVAVSAIAAAILVPMRPLASPDVTHLAADVRTLWLHGRFPAFGPNAPAHVDDPIANQVAVYRSGPSGYGPVAYAVGGIALPFTGNGLAANVAGQKAVAGACLVAAAFLVGLAAKRLGQKPAAAAGFIGLNPLLLFEFAGDGHDDSIMIAIGALAVMFIFEDRWRSRLIGAGIGMLSVLTKFTLILAAPVVVAAWFPRYRRWLALLIAALALLVLVAIGFRYGVRIGTIGPATAFSLTTPQNVLGHWFDGGRNFRNEVVFASYAAFVVISVIVVYKHPLETVQDKIAAAALLMWVFVFACSPGMLPWYQSWYLPFAALSGRRWLIAASIAFSLGAFWPILALHWESDLRNTLSVSQPVDKVVLLLWVVTGAVALGFWLADRSAGQKHASQSTRQAVRAEQRRQARSRA